MTKAKTEKKEAKLPQKLSACLEIAIKDLTQVERMKKAYVVDMDTYHDPHYEGTELVEGDKKPCTVCFAGAVMARTLKSDPTRELAPSDFESHNEERLDALDCLRLGSIEDAVRTIGQEMPFGLASHVEVTPYDSYYPSEFKDDMKRLTKLLKVFNL